MKKVVFLMLSIFLLSQSILPVSAVDRAVKYGTSISFDNSDDGVVSVFYNSSSEKKMKLMIQFGDQKEYYNLFNEDVAINYPLLNGDGVYKVAIYENISGTKYKQITAKSKFVEVENERAVYLQSVLEIRWDETDESIQLAEDLIEEAIIEKSANNTLASVSALPMRSVATIELTELETVQTIYEYVLENITYDYNKINTLDYSYIPNNDATLEVGSGICYDYSALVAAMLRSRGIPTKMVKGYANGSSTYHAWNEIYLEDEERWIVVDPTNDAYLVQHNYSYELEKDSSKYTKVKEF